MRLNTRFYAALFGFFVAFIGNAQTLSTLSNLKPRVDTTGEIVRAHQGCLLQSDGLFYLYGVDQSIQCYRSIDLNVWEPVAVNLKPNQEGIIHQPKVLYNQKTGYFVLWFLWVDAQGLSHYAVAKSKKPTGTFQLVHSDVKMFNQVDGLSSFNVFVDVDGIGYLAYTTERNLGVSVEVLSEDYLSSSLKNGGYFVSGYQVESMFARNGKYYVLMDKVNQFDIKGSGSRVYVSNRPLDSYVFRRNINRYPGTPAAILVDKKLEPNLYATIQKLQNGNYAPVELEFDAPVRLDCVKMVLFTGNRVQATPAVYDPIRTPVMEVQQWKNGGWVSIPSSQTAYTSSVYTIVSLRFSEVENQRLRIRFASAHNSTIFMNEIETSLHYVPVSIACQAYVCNLDDAHCLPRIPGQNIGVFPIRTKAGLHYIWMADLWGSASDNQTSHDYQYWSKPLEFSDFGDIEPLQWSDRWSLQFP